MSEWQPIEGHDGYSVSRDGQVKGPRGRLLTDEQAAEVRAAYARGGVSWADLGRQFNLGKKSIGRIVKGESYV